MKRQIQRIKSELLLIFREILPCKLYIWGMSRNYEPTLSFWTLLQFNNPFFLCSTWLLMLVLTLVLSKGKSYLINSLQTKLTGGIFWIMKNRSWSVAFHHRHAYVLDPLILELLPLWWLNLDLFTRVSFVNTKLWVVPTLHLFLLSTFMHTFGNV